MQKQREFLDNFKAVESSNIQAVYFNEEGLYVKFHNGGVYNYPDVTDTLYNDFVTAESLGKFFHKNIKSLDFNKVEIV